MKANAPRTTGKPRIRVEWESLAWALESHDEEHWLDPATGDVVPDPREVGEGDLGEDWIRVAPMDSREAWSDRAAFTEEVATGAAQARLQDALEGKGAFSRFKRALLSEPDLDQKWYAYHDACMRQRVEEWLEEHGLQAEVVGR